MEQTNVVHSVDSAGY